MTKENRCSARVITPYFKAVRKQTHSEIDTQVVCFQPYFELGGDIHVAVSRREFREAKPDINMLFIDHVVSLELFVLISRYAQYHRPNVCTKGCSWPK